MKNYFEVKLIKSIIGTSPKKKAIIKAMGFKKLNSSVKLLDNPMNRGMINNVIQMVEVKYVNSK